MTIKQEIQRHIKDGKIDTYGALLLLGIIITTLNKVMEITIDESKQNK